MAGKQVALLINEAVSLMRGNKMRAYIFTCSTSISLRVCVCVCGTQIYILSFYAIYRAYVYL